MAGNGRMSRTGEAMNRQTAPWDRHAGRGGEVNHGLTMGSLTKRSWEKYLAPGSCEALGEEG